MSSSNQNTTQTTTKEKEENTKKVLRPCCVCKETRMVRDECIILNGEESCGALIEAHKKCLKEYGFEM
uniref:Cytochrome c oxidase copper chaperone n=1 Tax=Meloidogyne incognita TaxID=6306 RepID=A0A914LTX6_MELIC